MSNKCESARGQRALTDERENITGENLDQLSLFGYFSLEAKLRQLRDQQEAVEQGIQHAKRSGEDYGLLLADWFTLDTEIAALEGEL